MGERISNLFGFLLSLTFFSLLLAVMLVAVNTLPDAPLLPPPTLPSEARSAPVRPPRGSVAAVGLLPVPEVAPIGPAAPVVAVPGTTPAEAGPGGVDGGLLGPGRVPPGGGAGPALPTGGREDGPSKGEPAKGPGKKAADEPRRVEECEEDEHPRSNGKGHNKRRGGGHCADHGGAGGRGGGRSADSADSSQEGRGRSSGGDGSPGKAEANAKGGDRSGPGSGHGSGRGKAKGKGRKH